MISAIPDQEPESEAAEDVRIRVLMTKIDEILDGHSLGTGVEVLLNMIAGALAYGRREDSGFDVDRVIDLIPAAIREAMGGVQ